MQVSIEAITALVVALTGLLGAVLAVYVQLRQTHNLLNGRMSELIDTTKLAAHLSGQQQGVEDERARLGLAPGAEGQTAPPNP